MAKQTITITVDADIIEEIRQLHINISGEINEYLRSLLARHNEDIEGINIRLERIQLEKSLKKLNHWQNISKQTQTRIMRWEELQKEKEEKQLEQEKKEIESRMKCIKCGEIDDTDSLWKKFKAGNVCSSCYGNMTAEDFRKWSG